MSYRIEYSDQIDLKRFARLPAPEKQAIKKAIEDKLTHKPEIFGKPLRQSLMGYRTLRIGDSRVIFKIDGDCVRIIAIGHRSTVYKQLEP